MFFMVLSFLAISLPAAAEESEVQPVTVNVRVEGMNSTLWSGTVTFSTSTITDKEGDTHTVEYPSALGALHAAAEAGGFEYIVSSVWGDLGFVESVNGETHSDDFSIGWLYQVNWGSPDVAAVDYELNDNDEVLWYFGHWMADTLKITVDKTVITAAEEFTVTVEAFNGENWDAVQGATVQAESNIYTTDVEGKVEGISLSPGSYDIQASKGGYETHIRSNTETVFVYVPLYLKPGWNFISIPKRLASGSSTAANLFSSVDTGGHSIFSYDSAGNWRALEADDTISPLEGIWIYSVDNAELRPVFDSNPRRVPPTRQLSAGWNAIGYTGLEPASANSALTSVESKWAYLIGFDAVTQSYEITIINNAPGDVPHSETRVMDVWKGYWLFMTGDGELAAIGL